MKTIKVEQKAHDKEGMTTDEIAEFLRAVEAAQGHPNDGGSLVSARVTFGGHVKSLSVEITT